MPNEAKRSEAEFEKWWTFGGSGIAVRVLTMTSEEQRAEGIRCLCRIAYFQGRIDEAGKMIRQLDGDTRSLNPERRGY